MSPIEKRDKEISQLIRALADAARRLANLDWITFCTGPEGYATKLEGRSAEYRRFAQHLFQEGFQSGYMLYSYGWPALENIGELIGESWCENDFNDMHGSYIGNPNSTHVTDTVPESEARELFQLGFKRALLLLIEMKLSAPFE